MNGMDIIDKSAYVAAALILILPVLALYVLIFSVGTIIIRRSKKIRKDGKNYIFQWIWNKDRQLWEFPDHEKKDKSHAYKARFILKHDEHADFQLLKTYAANRGFEIYAKVRLLDLIEPKGGDNFMALTGYIQSRYVDFVIADENMFVKAVIILDKTIYNSTEQVKNELITDELLTYTGYKVIHVREITEEILDGI